MQDTTHPEGSPPEEFDVFISYSRADIAFARALGKQLASYVPARGLGLPLRRMKVFRDESDIKGTDYFESIADFLRRSRKLVLICSPNARASSFVDDEVQRFLSSHDPGHVIPILLAGIPNNEGRAGQEKELAFPEALCAASKLPLAVSYRDFNPRKDAPHRGVYYGSWYTLLANVYDVSRADIEQRDKKRRTRNLVIASGAVAGTVAVLTISLIATLVARDEARTQRDRATAALQRASARLLTMQARDQASQSFARSLLLSAAAVEATGQQNFPEPAAEQQLRDALSRSGGTPMATPEDGERPMLYDISSNRVWAVSSGPGTHPTLWRFDDSGRVAQKIALESVQSPELLRFSPNSRFLIWAQSPIFADPNKAAGSQGGHVTLIPLASAGQPDTYARAALSESTERIGNLQVSSDARTAVLSMNNPESRPVHVYQFAEGGTSIKELPVPMAAKVASGAERWSVSIDGTWLVAHQKQALSAAWRISDGRIAEPFILASASKFGDRFVGLSRDHQWLVTFGDSSTARLWRLAGDAPAQVHFDLTADGGNNIDTAAFSPDGKWIVAAPCLWRLDVPDMLSTRICLPIPRQYVTGGDRLEFTADSRRLIAIGAQGKLRVSVWDLTSANPLASALRVSGEFELSADRRWLLEKQDGLPAKVWNLRDRALSSGSAMALTGPPVTDAVFAADSKTLATLHADGSIRSHALDGESSLQTTLLKEPSGAAPNRLKFSTTGLWLLAQSSSGRPHFTKPDSPYLFRLRGTAAPEMTRLDDRSLQFVTSRGAEVLREGASAAEFEFSQAEDRLIARTTLSSTAYLWNLNSGRINESRRTLVGHERPISYFDFVAGGTLITSELFDGSDLAPYRARPRMWEPGMQPVLHPDTAVAWVRFNRKGRTLAAIGDMGTLALYRLGDDGALNAILTVPDVGGGVVGRRFVGAYAPAQRAQFSPAFDAEGRWLFASSGAGALLAIDCGLTPPKVHELLPANPGREPFFATDASTSLLLTSVQGQDSQLQAWDFGGETPRPLAYLDLDWAAPIYSRDPPVINTAFVSRTQIVVSAPARAGGGVEVWSYSLPAGTRRQLAKVATDRSTSASADGAVVAGSEGVYDVRSQRLIRLDGPLPAPSDKGKEIDTRFGYVLSPNGRWAVGRRYTIEGFPEFGRRSYLTWRQIIDLQSPDPGRAVVALPEAKRSIFAEFSADSSRWISVSADGEITIVTLPQQGAARMTEEKIDSFFSGTTTGGLFWPTGETSYQVSLSAAGDWLATRRGGFMYLIRLRPPFEGKLLRGFEAEQGTSNVAVTFSSNDDLAIVGRKFWRARAEAELLLPVTLGEPILAASADGKWLATSSGAGISVQPLELPQLVRHARRIAGRDLTPDEKEQFLGLSAAPPPNKRPKAE